MVVHAGWRVNWDVQGAQLEVIVQGLQWAEGPLWVNDKASGRAFLLFSDTVSGTTREYAPIQVSDHVCFREDLAVGGGQRCATGVNTQHKEYCGQS
jgi:sugar lactone lactonase YvrE